MDMQETFNSVVHHLFKQGKQAADNTGTCKYRVHDEETGKTLMCAVGCLVPDEIYKPEYEGSINQECARPIVEFLLGTAAPFNDSQELRLLNTLQRAHDTETNWKEPIRLANVLRVIAVAFGLNDYLVPWPKEGETWEGLRSRDPRFRDTDNASNN